MEPWMEPLLGALLIFCLRLIDVSMGTVRILMAVRGRRLLAGAIGFFEVTIFLVAISQVVANIGNWWNVLGYAGGFAVGTILGMTIEKKLANENFTSRAPANVVQRERDRLANLTEQRVSIQAALEKLRSR